MVCHLVFGEYKQIPLILGSMYGSRRVFIVVDCNFKFSWPSAFEVIEAFHDLRGLGYNFTSSSARVAVVALDLASIYVLAILQLKFYQFIETGCCFRHRGEGAGKVDV
jgi:hypothetical protein